MEEPDKRSTGCAPRKTGGSAKLLYAQKPLQRSTEVAQGELEGESHQRVKEFPGWIMSDRGGPRRKSCRSVGSASLKDPKRKVQGGREGITHKMRGKVATGIPLRENSGREQLHGHGGAVQGPEVLQTCDNSL